MRAPLALWLTLPALLAACGKDSAKLPSDYVLSGTIRGEWGSSPALRLALVGTGLPVALTVSSGFDQRTWAAGANAWTYGFDLPRTPNVAGVYQVIAFNDSDGNAKFDLGEQYTRNQQWLIYSLLGGDIGPINIPEFLPGGGAEAIPALSVAKGWNLYDRLQPLGAANPRPVTKITGYDLSRAK